ncbi:hypothetical protein ACLMJK_004935 [Lecanora helva]
MEETRVKTFQTLKPVCVSLSQVALRYKNKKATRQELVSSLEALLETLKGVSHPENALDPKLAEYCFFPLSHIFRDAKNLPVRVIEVAVQCLQVLIWYGWRGQVSPDLGKQLLILLCFLAGGSATDSKVKDVNEELSTAAFNCLASLVDASRGSFLGTKSISPENFPVLGHTVTVVLDGITDGPSVKVQLAALDALKTLIVRIQDYEALRSVFPGTVSSLTKVVSPKSKTKPSYKILTASLHNLTQVICRVIDDEHAGNSGSAKAPAEEAAQDGGQGTGSWAAKTGENVKMAIVNILPLRYHDKQEVQSALFNLCTSIIKLCRQSLSQCLPMLLETMVAVDSQYPGIKDVNHWSLVRILANDADILEMVKASLHDWMVALPRIMQSNDETRKRRTLSQIATAFKALQGQVVNLEILSDSMVTSLRGSVSLIIHASSKAINPVSESSLDVTDLVQINRMSSKLTSFDPVLFNDPSSKATAANIQDLVVQLKASTTSRILQQNTIQSLRTTSGDEQLAALWLSLRLLDDLAISDSIADQYLNLPPDRIVPQPYLDDIYAFSLDTLSTSTFEDEDRWRLQSLALEAVALQGRHQGYDFRPELVDALYPILERLGSNNAALQQHAITCLNIVSTACEYPNAAALIVDNADYLVNAVALKLNTFDISPQTPQVLVMMIKLSGSALIPYLDDLVESIFAILACYHGYPKLVESLFSVLNAIVEEAAKTPTPAIKPSANPITKPQPFKPFSMEDLADLLRSNREAYDARDRPVSPPPEESTSPPNQGQEEEQPDPSFPPRSTTPPPPPLSKPYTIVQSITNLTPSHLTTPSAPLRANILHLLVPALPFLATNADAFLPLAATLWPSITPRLYDAEPYVTLAAARALGTLCDCAGDFLYSRTEDEWAKIRKLYERVEQGKQEEVKVQEERNRGSGMRWKVWDAVVGLLVHVVKDVGVSMDLEGEVFEMLGGLAGEREDVREALEGLNADALWLIEVEKRVREGGTPLVKPEAFEGFEFRDLDFGWMKDG